MTDLGYRMHKGKSYKKILLRNTTLLIYTLLEVAKRIPNNALIFWKPIKTYTKTR